MIFASFLQENLILLFATYEVPPRTCEVIDSDNTWDNFVKANVAIDNFSMK